MDLVVDANVLFSAAIRDSMTAELLMRDDLHLYAPEYLFDEFEKYEDELLDKTHRSSQEFRRFMSILQSRIHLVPKEEFEHRLRDAEDVSPDPDDIPYFALALHLDARIWSDDGELQGQDGVPVITTSHLVEGLG